MTNQLAAWQGKFGEAYTDRNVVDWRARLPAFREILDSLAIRRVLEVGCNRGHNLVTLAALLGRDAEIVGVEPNDYALRLARSLAPSASILRGSLCGLAFKDACFDLVITAGVLIHVPPEDLPVALDEVHRVSGTYVLAIEYFDQLETTVQYRGRSDLLWKGDFLKSYLSRFPDLMLVRTGFLVPKDGFDNMHWWLLKKPEAVPHS